MEVTFRMRTSILMQRGGFDAVCGPWRPGAASGNGTVGKEKSSAPVEMRGHSVLRCKPCGHFLPEAGRRGTQPFQGQESSACGNDHESKRFERVLEPIGCERVKQDNWDRYESATGRQKQA